jgi:hypothetical protein
MPNALMRLLMIIGVLLCSMHLAEPASAHSTASDAAFHLSVDEDNQDRQEPASKLAHGGHHHCPVAPDLRSTSDTTPLIGHAPLFASPVAQLTSRASPPLLDPPLFTI